MPVGKGAPRGGRGGVGEGAAAGDFVKIPGEGLLAGRRGGLGEVEALGVLAQARLVGRRKAAVVFGERRVPALDVGRGQREAAGGGMDLENRRGELAQAVRGDGARLGDDGLRERRPGGVRGAQDGHALGGGKVAEPGVLEGPHQRLRVDRPHVGRAERRGELGLGVGLGEERDEAVGGVGVDAVGGFVVVEVVVLHVGAREEGGQPADESLAVEDGGHQQDASMRAVLLGADRLALREEVSQGLGVLVYEKPHRLVDGSLVRAGDERRVDGGGAGGEPLAGGRDDPGDVEFLRGVDGYDVLQQRIAERGREVRHPLHLRECLGVLGGPPLGEGSDGRLDLRVRGGVDLAPADPVDQIDDVDVEFLQVDPRGKAGGREAHPRRERVAEEEQVLPEIALDGDEALRVGGDLLAQLVEGGVDLGGGPRGAQPLPELRTRPAPVAPKLARGTGAAARGDQRAADERAGMGFGPPFLRVGEKGGPDVFRRGGLHHVIRDDLEHARRDEPDARRVQVDGVLAEESAHVPGGFVQQRLDVVRDPLRVAGADGVADASVPLLRRCRGDDGAPVLRDVDGAFARRQVRERQHGLVVAQGVAAQRAVQLRERPREVARDPVVHAVDARKRLPVVDAALRQHHDHGGAELEARVGRVSEAVDPVEAGLGRGERAELRAHGGAARIVGSAVREADHHLLELADERRLALAGTDAHELAGLVQVELDHRLALRARPSV